MPGLIEMCESGYPKYKYKKLENVPPRAKFIGWLLMFLELIGIFVGISLLIPLFSYFHKLYEYVNSLGGDPRNDLSYNCLTISSILDVFESIFIFVCIKCSYARCCQTQRHGCLIKGLGRGIMIFFAVICSFQCSTYGMSSMYLWLKIAFIVLTMFLFGSIYAIILYLKKYCQCKECLNIKDVKIIYRGRTMDTNETTRITRLLLEEYFNIVLSEYDYLAIQINGGEIIHKFMTGNSDKRIQLHAGNYVLKAFDVQRIVALRSEPPVDAPEVAISIEEACEETSLTME